jgi:hypothetical protein
LNSRLDRKNTATLVALPFVGFVLFVLPTVINPPSRDYGTGLLRLCATAVETAGPAQWALLFALGVAVGSYTRGHVWALGILCVLLLPFLAIIEMFAEPGSHSLLLIEFAIYGFYAAIVTGGVVVGRKLFRDPS